jgi:membrane fusion protein, macrolide-specific efflux system
MSKIYNKTKPAIIKTMLFSLSVCLLMLTLSSCFLLPEDEEVLASPVQLQEPVAAKIITEKVKRGNIMNKVKFWGAFLSPVQYDLSFTYMGRLKNVYAAAGDNVSAGQILAELESDDYESQLKMLELNLKKTQMTYERIKTESEINGGGNKYQLEDAKMNMELAELPIKTLKENMAKTRITAPISGILSYVDDIEVGENVNLRVTFATVCDRNGMSLVVKKDKSTEWLAAGMPVNVKYNSRDYTGTIIKTPEDNANEKIESFKNAYIIKVDGLDTDTVSLNDTAAVECIMQQADDVLMISKSNIIGDKKNVVYIYKNGVIEEREIVTGIESDNSVEIEVKQGLAEDDEVVVQ